MKNISIKSLRDKQKDKVEIAKDFFKKPKNEINELTEQPYRPKKIKFIFKTILLILFIFIIGGIGGITIDRFALPYLLFQYPDLNNYEF
ncbi:MAG: hypothetical protein KAS78_05320, partial [Candidatus Pacebacteria bacterium]|nr:hypothetical protein [Candidatus Paceibacterota bacterium]